MRWTRRHLLRLAAAAGAGTLAGGCRRGVVLDDLSELDSLADPTLAAELAAQATAAARRHGVAGPAPAATAAPAPRPRALGIASDLRLTPNDAFYTMTYGTVPEVDADAWRLEIDGRVGAPVSLSLADLRALPAVTAMRTLMCISNPAGGDLIGNAVWTGVRLRDVLALAEPSADAPELRLASADRYHTGIVRALADDPESLLVYEMNGAPLPAAHGFPVRCLFPGRYGQKQPKWLTRITLQAERHAGHWEAQGWSDTAEIQVTSRFDAPGDRATVEGPVTVRGIAFAGRSGVARVELVVDDGDTAAASFVKAPPPFTDLAWAEWAWTWDAPPAGNHALLARAVDGDGRRQSRPRDQLLGGTFPDGTTAMDRLRLFVPAG